MLDLTRAASIEMSLTKLKYFSTTGLRSMFRYAGLMGRIVALRVRFPRTGAPLV